MNPVHTFRVGLLLGIGIGISVSLIAISLIHTLVDTPPPHNHALSSEQWQLAIAIGEDQGATRAMKACLEQRGLRDERRPTEPGK